MKTLKFTIRTCLWIFIAGLFVFGGSTMAIEKAKYQVLESTKNFELRQYAPRIVAETMVEGKFEEVGNKGFRLLYDYINGNNVRKQSISMTAPVTQEAGSEKIARTAPVNQESEGKMWRITFLMPLEYTLDTLPRPLDKRIKLKQEPGSLMAAIQYSGTWSQKRFEEKKALLQVEIERRGLRPIGVPVWARYDPPFMPWFLRRNEVLIPVIGQK
jgi:hypothetical protein